MGPWKRECKALRRPYKGVLPWGSVPSNVAMFFQLATFQRLAGSLSGDLDPHSAFRRVERLGMSRLVGADANCDPCCEVTWKMDRES